MESVGRGSVYLDGGVMGTHFGIKYKLFMEGPKIPTSVRITIKDPV